MFLADPPFEDKLILVRAVDLDLCEVSFVDAVVEMAFHHPERLAMGHDARWPPEQVVAFCNVDASQEFVLSRHGRERDTGDVPVPRGLDDVLDVSFTIAPLAPEAILVGDVPSIETGSFALRSGLVCS